MLILDRIETSIADKSVLSDLQRNLNMSCVYMTTISSRVADKCPAESDTGQNILPGSVSSSFLYLAQ